MEWSGVEWSEVAEKTEGRREVASIERIVQLD